ncbi:hypothetical protein IG631_16052 [Alternaria alternata]|nr:hypothetical protein IG631_16052 [Alternaria alternata]
MRRHGSNCGHGLAILGSLGLHFECASLINNIAPDIDIAKTLCHECRMKGVEDKYDIYRNLFSWQPGYRRQHWQGTD